ncbi:MAG: acyl carrier protein phosphodiesterase [Ginsengibacter sp.]
MNYLAHAYLSFSNPDVLVGNMISDYVKGKKKFDYPKGIQRGMDIHRAIDTYTDSHIIVKEAKQYFQKPYRLYSGAFIDVVFDHFLATDKKEFPNDESLLLFSQTVYTTLAESLTLVPVPFQKMFPYMQKQNWLYNYQFDWGIQKSFEGLRHRAQYIPETESAYEILNSNYSALQNLYASFFPQLKEFVKSY